VKIIVKDSCAGRKQVHAYGLSSGKAGDGLECLVPVHGTLLAMLLPGRMVALRVIVL
jgi:hypothetical protein